MPSRDPNNYQIVTYIWMLVIACWGGFANYISRLKTGNEKSFRFMVLLGELCISGFSGTLTYYLCQHYQMESLISAVFVGISGHAGGKTVLVLESIINRQLNGINHKFGMDEDIERLRNSDPNDKKD